MVIRDYLQQLSVTDSEMTQRAAKKQRIIKDARDTHIILQNAFKLLSQVSPPATKDLGPFLHADMITEKSPLMVPLAHKKVYSEAWLGMMKHPLDPVMYKSLLETMHEAMIPHLTDPRLMLDFLVDAYDQGGVIALLALNGLFTLITQYNL